MEGFLWPLIVALLVLGFAYLILYFLADVFEFGSAFVWIIAGFFIMYIAASAYLRFNLPSPFTANAQTRVQSDGLIETSVSDVVVND